MAETPNADPTLALAAAVKSMNDTLGPEGLVPSALVFGEFPKVYTRSETPAQRPMLEDRASVALCARKEMERIMAEMRTKRALKHKVPTAADTFYQPGDKVLVWREKIVESRIGEWLGPFEVLATDEEKKLVYVKDVKIGAARPFNVSQVKRYLTPDMVAHCFMSDLGDNLRKFGTSANDDSEVYLTEILNPNDPRSDSIEMGEAKKAEIRSLLERGTFKVILREDIPRDGNVLSGRFVLTIKSTEYGKIKHKARYVIGGHRDKFKDLMVHSTSTLQPQSVRLLLALAAIFNFDIWTSDLRQAYLQSAEPLAREIFIAKPVPELELKPSQCLQLLKPLYGLCESGDIWHETLANHHKEDLGMKSLRSDPALYSLIKEGILRGLSGGYVDDLIRAGDEYFKKVSQKTNEKFDMAENEKIPCTFTGFSLSHNRDGEVIQDQHEYLKKLETLSLGASFGQFRSMRMKLAWLSNTRPDCLFEISQLAQVTEEMFSSSPRETARRLNKAVKFAVDNRLSLRIPKLDKKTLRVIGYSDSSFANNADLSSQLGHICFLGDASGAVVPIHFKSYKSRRVTRSAMAGAVIAFSDLFDVAATLADEASLLIGTKVPVQLLTDSKSLFDVISKGSRTSEERMMLDIAAAREGFKNRVISDIGFVRSSYNIADGLTKSMQQRALQQVLRTGHLNVRPEQWIIRK